MQKLASPLIAAALCLAVAVSARAQIGVGGGAILTNASVSVSGSELETESLTRLSAGVYYATGGMFGLMFGGYYTQKGFEVAGSNTTFTPSYVEIPVMAVVRLPLISQILGSRLYGGGNLGVEVNCETSGSLSELPGFSCDETNTFDFGLRVGLGVQINFFGLDFSYVHGLTDIAKQDGIEIKNRSWSLALLLGIG